MKITFAFEARLSGTSYLYPVWSQLSAAVISTPGQAALLTALAPSPVYTYAYILPQPEGLVA